MSVHFVAPPLLELLVPIDSLRAYEGNARVHEVDQLRDSLRRHGQYRPVVVNRRDQQILAGNGTVDAARLEGWSHVAATFVDVDEVEARRIVLVDNRLSDLASYDEAALLALLDSLKGDLSGTGYSEADMVALRPPEARTHVDEAPPLPLGPAVSALGDRWVLGDHRLVVGDSRDPRVFEALLGGERVDLVWTDPPYGVDYAGQAGTRRLRIEGDRPDQDQLRELLTRALGASLRASRPGAAWYVAGPDGPSRFAFDAVMTGLGVWRQTLVWAKDAMVLSRADYHHEHEVLFYGWSPGEEPSALPLEPTYEPGGDAIAYGWAPGAEHHRPPNRRQTTVWYAARPKASVLHPTMKPVALIVRSLENSSDAGALVLDPFAGSGSTLIACHTVRRRARLVELVPGYADVICRRWQEHTGVVPVLERWGQQPQPVEFAGNEEAAPIARRGSGSPPYRAST